MSSGTAELLTLLIDNRRYAVEARCCHEAARPGPVTPLPFVPGYIEGLVNIDGRIATQLDLGRLFAGSEVPAPGEALLLLETGRTPCALRVQQVGDRISVGLAQVERLQPAVGDAATARCLAGRFSHAGDEVLLLDPAQVGLLVRANPLPPGQPGLVGKAPQRQAVAEENVQVLAVKAAGARYGFVLGSIIELVERQACTPLAGAPAWLAGVSPLRGEPFVMASLPALLGQAVPDDAGLPPWALMVNQDGMTYGVLVDEVSGIEDYAPSAVTPIHHPDSAIAAVLETRDGELAMLVEPQRLLNMQKLDELRLFAPDVLDTMVGNEQASVECLAVSIAGERFAIPLDCINRIVAYRPCEPLESEAGHVLGAIDVDGRVVPVVNANPDVPAHFDGWSEYVVIEHAQASYAVRVSHTHEVLQLPAKDITQSVHAGKAYVAAVARCGDELYSMFNPEKLAWTAAAAVRPLA
jgi:chemotaxis signal transduction protein